LVQAIERLSSSYRTFSTSFSWTLALTELAFEAKSTEYESSTGEGVEEQVIKAPMSILDNLLVCEQRAKIMLSIGSPSTPSMVDGRTEHRRMVRRLLAVLRRLFERRNFTVLDYVIEAPTLSLATRTGGRRTLKLIGVPDIVIFVSSPKRQLFVLNIEYSTYRAAMDTIILRQALYAHILYRLFGYPVVPALTIESGTTGPQAFLLVAHDKNMLEKIFRRIFRRLAELAAGADPRPAKRLSVCDSCPLTIRSFCAYQTG
jgi:hypothetical protein